ncbi:hypothetical protein P175DRAFT_039537 [Aspergillus ochraceoroseus IBT 24754]|uniref:RNA polymerase II assembly factor Rtp1 C-terminal domain-containing protein n=1 Tax=Aspergillus ochraceoroseus IBT 24754 TaxID=1392256 RepID=A0A2T5M7N0_9EURO|nr:uncharacterized protein P175DRAFT_039537 [Aspergillus ochraceoroseus IBT 24754]PTU24542.1 hypothetical protein P175DRAFT_039537 [Aspergillus ochraceoroseus IBT 24754]
MGCPLRIKEAFAAASEFLGPVLQREELQKSRGDSLIAILNRNLPGPSLDDASTRANVIGKALDLLCQIHVAFVSPVNESNKDLEEYETAENAGLEDAKRRRILHTLLDLISLEGIYPSLSSGVGIPLQQRVISVLPAGVIAQQQAPVHETPQDESLLCHILLGLSDIIFDERPSIQPVIRGRILSDIVSVASDLGYNPGIVTDDRQPRYRHILSKVVEETPSAILLSTLSAFLQANPASWFKLVISGLLSRVPLRDNGVLQTIIFLASQFAPSLGQEPNAQASNGPHITVNAIMHASRLLSSVPQDMDPTNYFTVIGPQLLSLIDGDDPDLRKAAAYIVGNGILGKRAYGAPGTIGHSIFLEPIFKTITGTLDGPSRKYMLSIDSTQDHCSGQILSCEWEVMRAIDRLKTLVLQPPNPGLVKRVVFPVLLPLWGLACFTTEEENVPLHEDVMTVLQTYFGISVGLPPLQKIIDNFLWDGGPTWTYGTDSANKILLQNRTEARPGKDLVSLVDTLQSRAKLFRSLLDADPSREERTGEVFLYVSENWLVKSSADAQPLHKLQLVPDEDDSEIIIRKLTSAKLAETLLDNFKDTLSRRPLKVLELIKQIIDGELNDAKTRSRNSVENVSPKVSLSSLANIVPSHQVGEDTSAEPESTQSLSVVLSLLSTILASPEFAVSNETSELLENIKGKLDELLPYLPPSLSKSGTTSSMLLEIQLASPEQQESGTKGPEIPDFETHRRALANLNSDLPPVQAEGFSLLSDLIKKASPILDIPSTLTLLLSIITDSSEAASNDEFIYLNAIKLIGALASRHPRTVVKTLMDRYIDRSENASLDQRLKIGESLLRTVQDLDEALAGETAKILGDGLITVAGRRAHKPQAQKARKQALDREKRRKGREERPTPDAAVPPGWKFSSSPLPSSSSNAEEDIHDSDSESETPEQAARSANIISAWAAGASQDQEPDDLRIRASALSILATAVQTNLLGLGPSIVSSAVDLALATLTLEPDDESAILRRASAVLLLDILKALDSARETRGSQNLGFGFSLMEERSAAPENGRGPATIGNISHMLRTLAGVESRETDTIVRGHIRVLTESLEAWVEKSLLWGIGDQAAAMRGNEPRFGLGDQIAGLRLDPLAGRSEGSRPRIEEIE